MRLVSGLVTLVLLSEAALAAPPPPALYPRELSREVDGYDLQPIYSAYHHWVGRGREPALEKALPYESEWQGKHNWGVVVDSKLVHYDFGVIRVDRLERYCEGDWLDEKPAGNCDYRYRYAFVPGSLYSDDKRDKLILDSFRPHELAERLAKHGVATSSDFSSFGVKDKLTRIFEEHTDLQTFYSPLVELYEVQASKCPGLRRSLARFNKIVLDLAPEKLGDSSNDFPVHGQQTQIRMTATTPRGGKVAIEGAQPLFYLLEPVWAAVEACSK